MSLHMPGWKRIEKQILVCFRLPKNANLGTSNRTTLLVINCQEGETLVKRRHQVLAVSDSCGCNLKSNTHKHPGSGIDSQSCHRALGLETCYRKDLRLRVGGARG